MRRSQNEIKNKEEIIKIIKACDVVRIGISVKDVPYIVPLNFGFEENCFYFHGAKEGRKMNMLRENPNVCFELDRKHELVGESDRACDWTMTYESVMGTGRMTIIEDSEEKRKALNILMGQYSDRSDYTYEDKMIERIGVMKLEIKELSGKRSRK